jgi:hypothetical protein
MFVRRFGCETEPVFYFWESPAMKSWSVVGLVVLTCVTGWADDAKPKTKVLMLTQSKGFVHGSVKRPAEKLAPSEVAMIQLGQQTSLFDVHCTQDAAADFTKSNLQKYQVVMFYTTGDLPIEQADRDYFFKEWLTAKGHGFIGFHSALDTYHNYQPYWDILGMPVNSSRSRCMINRIPR